MNGVEHPGIQIGWDVVQMGGDKWTYKYTFEDFESPLMLAPVIDVDGNPPPPPPIAIHADQDPDPSLTLIEGPNGLGRREVLPEPGTLALMGVGSVALGIAMRRTVKPKEPEN